MTILCAQKRFKLIERFSETQQNQFVRAKVIGIKVIITIKFYFKLAIKALKSSLLSGQSYEGSAIVNYDSIVLPTIKLPLS